MSKQFAFTSYNPDIDSLATAVEQLEDLDKELEASNSDGIRAFNRAYLIITRYIYKQLGADYFNNDDFVQKLETTCVQRYTHVLWEYLHNRRVPAAWEALFDNIQNKALSRFTQMTLGMNAHVNHDIPYALYEISARKTDQVDFNRINTIIRACRDEVVAFFREFENTPAFRLTEKFIPQMYSYFMSVTIQRWRSSAWYRFKKLQRGGLSEAELEAETKNTTAWLLRLKNPSALLERSAQRS